MTTLRPSPLVSAPLPAKPGAPSLAEWQSLIEPAPGQGERVEVGGRKDEPLPRSIAEMRQRVQGLTYHPIDPYVASVAGSIGADQIELPKGEQTVAVACPGYYAEDVEVFVGLQNGPDAPMLLILPGIHNSGGSSHATLFKKLALERGMNYVCLPNSLSPDMLDDKPLYHPANPRVDSLATREIVQNLKSQYPGYFNDISVAGYSYGGLHGANLMRLDEESAGPRLFTGSLVAISPPDNLEHSMEELDSLRQVYENGSGTIADTGLLYKRDVRKFGYENFSKSSLWKHGEGTNLDEAEIADKYGSRDGLKRVLEIVDSQFAHNLLPMNTEAYKDANLWQKHKMRKEHEQIVKDITYRDLSDRWFSQDEWLKQNQLTPGQMAEKYSFQNAMEALEQTPVLMLASADDYILKSQDVAAFRDLEEQPGDLEISRVMDRGGHVGLDWNPDIANALIDFAVAF